MIDITALPPNVAAVLTKLNEVLPSVQPVPNDLPVLEELDHEAWNGSAEHDCSALLYAACLGAVAMQPDAIERPYVALCMLSGRYEEALKTLVLSAAQQRGEAQHG